MNIVWIRRHFGGYRYHNCSNCGHEDMIQKPIEISLPYCGDCGKAIEDASHNYCGWCGSRIANIEGGQPDEAEREE